LKAHFFLINKCVRCGPLKNVSKYIFIILNKNKFYNNKKLVNKNTILFKFPKCSTNVQSGPDSYLNYALKVTQIL